MLNAGQQPSSKRDLMTLGAMAAVFFGIIAYWTINRAQRKIRRDVLPTSNSATELITTEDNDEYKRRAKRNRDRDLALRGDPGTVVVDEQRDDGPTGRNVTPGNLDWLTESMTADEVERAKFLPLLEKFTPLEYDAVRAFRAIMQDRVPSGFRTEFAAPDGGEGTVVDAEAAGFTLEMADGKKIKLAWDKVKIGDAFRIALEMTNPDGPEAQARDLIYLAQLATLAGNTNKASDFRVKAAVLHFRATLGKSAPAETKQLFEAARRLIDIRSASPIKRETDRDALALDMLHLSRLASVAGTGSDSADYASRALALDPLLEDEVEGRATRSLDRWLLENESWAWDPDKLSGADVRTANNLLGDSRAVLHLYRYMRTLGPERVARIAQEEPVLERLLRLPRQTRGRIYRAECGFIRKFKTVRLTKRPQHIDAGIQDLDFLFLSAKDSPGGKTRLGIYLVCIPRETNFRQGDFLSVTGVYLRRWPFKKPNGDWQWIPWIVATDIEKIELAGVKGWGTFILVLVLLGSAGAVALFLGARREWRELTASRDHLNARRRGGRNMIRRKVAAALAASGKEKKSTDDDKPDTASEKAPENKEPPDAAGPAPDGVDKKG